MEIMLIYVLTFLTGLFFIKQGFGQKAIENDSEDTPLQVGTIHDARKNAYELGHKGKLAPIHLNTFITQSIEDLYRKHNLGNEHDNKESTEKKEPNSVVANMRNFFTDNTKEKFDLNPTNELTTLVAPGSVNASIENAPNFASKLIRKLDNTNTHSSHENTVESNTESLIKNFSQREFERKQIRQHQPSAELKKYEVEDTWSALSPTMVDTASILASTFQDVDSQKLLDSIITKISASYGPEIKKEILPEHYEKLLYEYFSGITDYIDECVDKHISLHQAKEQALSRAVQKDNNKTSSYRRKSDFEAFDDLMELNEQDRKH